MSIWANGVITNKGLSLQAKLLEGTSLEITRAVTASGYVTPGLLQSQTNVTGQEQTLKIRGVTYPEEGKCALTCYLDNDGLSAGYTAMQVGVFAKDPDEGEILYFIVQDESGKGTDVPSESKMPGYNAEWTFYFQYGQSDNVTVYVDPSNTATIEMLNGKANVDLTNVENNTFIEKAIASGAATVEMLDDKANVDLTNIENATFLEKAIVSGVSIPIVTTTGTGEAYEVTVPGVDELTTGQTFIMIPHTSSTTTLPTLNVNGLGAKNIRQQLSFGTAGTAPGSIASWLSAGKPCMVTYDGTMWRVNISRPSAAHLYGTVPIESGGTAAKTPEGALSNLGAAAASDHNLATYTALDQIGMTAGSETMAGIASALDENTVLAITVTSANNAAAYPEYSDGCAVMTAKRLGDGVEFSFVTRTSGKPSLWTGFFNSVGWTGWHEVVTANDGTVPSVNPCFSEVAEWQDGNPGSEDRIGYFVCIDDTQAGPEIRKATASDNVRGVTMAAPGFAGNAQPDKYDSNAELLPQYNYVGVLGLMPVIDNGTCVINGYCMPGDDATAVPVTNGHGYRVVDRIDGSRVLIAVEPCADHQHRFMNTLDDHEERIRALELKVKRLEDMLFNDITGNPHSITFNSLDGLIVTGVWNEAKARLEC